MPDNPIVLERQLSAWASSAFRECGFDAPLTPIVEKVLSRLPSGLREMIAVGIEREVVVPQAHLFTLQGLGPGKGPYSWFSRDNKNKSINPNWEYFVQVAEYVRLVLLAQGSDFRVTFEDDLMDIGVYRDNRLILCCEVKETATQAARLVEGIRKYEAGVDWEVSDRGNDPLRKAKYLLKRRPAFFSVFAIGLRHEFSVEETNEGFHLEPDIVPIY